MFMSAAAARRLAVAGSADRTAAMRLLQPGTSAACGAGCAPTLAAPAPSPTATMMMQSFIPQTSGGDFVLSGRMCGADGLERRVGVAHFVERAGARLLIAEKVDNVERALA